MGDPELMELTIPNTMIESSSLKKQGIRLNVITGKENYISIKESANPIIIRLNMCSVNGRIDVVTKNIFIRKYGVCNDH